MLGGRPLRRPLSLVFAQKAVDGADSMHLLAILIVCIFAAAKGYVQQPTHNATPLFFEFFTVISH